jgi:biotin synthase
MTSDGTLARGHRMLAEKRKRVTRMWTDRMNEDVVGIVEKALSGLSLSAQDALELFRRVDVNSLEMGLLCAAANRLTWQRFGGMGEVFSQVGLNFAHCSLECGFCSFGALKADAEMMSLEEAVARARHFSDEGANAVGLMATADYPFERFLEIGRAARAALPPDYPLAANVADFGPSEAAALLDAGFTAL